MKPRWRWSALDEANRDHRYDKLIKNADQFLKTIQWGGDAQPTDKSDPAYGGADTATQAARPLEHAVLPRRPGRRRQRAGRSGRQAGVDLRLALSEPGKPAQHHALCRQESGRWFLYTPAAGGNSAADKTPNGGLRSYASMTYAGLKSMIYAGVGPDDPRVKAASKWCQMHYGLDENPGLGKAGQYYYYQTFAKGAGRHPPDVDPRRQGREQRSATTCRPPWSAGSVPTAPGSTMTRAGWRATLAWSPATRCSAGLYAAERGEVIAA